MRTELVDLLRRCGEQTSRKYRTFRVPMPALVPGVIELAEWESFHGAVISVTREEYSAVTGAKFFAFDKAKQCPECTTFGKYHRSTCSLRFTWNIDPESNRPTMEKASEAIKANRFRDATDVFVEYIDERLSSGDYGTVGVLLNEIDPTQVPPLVLTGILMITLPAKLELSGPRERFFERVKAALLLNSEFSEERVNSIEQRLR